MPRSFSSSRFVLFGAVCALLLGVPNRSACAQSAEAADLAVRVLALAVGGGEEDEDDGGCYFYDGGCQFGDDRSCTDLLEDAPGGGLCVWGGIALGVIALVAIAPSTGELCLACVPFATPAEGGTPDAPAPDSLADGFTSAPLFLPPEHPAFRQAVSAAEAEGVDVLVGRRLVWTRAERGVGLGPMPEPVAEVEWTAYDVRQRAFIPFEHDGLEARTLRPRVPVADAEAFADRLQERLKRAAPESSTASARADHSISR